VTSIQPALWVDRGAEAVTFYQAAFGAAVLHRAGDGEDADHPKGDQQPPPAVVAGAHSRYG